MKPYLISIYSYTEGCKNYERTFPRLGDSVEKVDCHLDSYPGHLHRWDKMPKDLDRNRVFIFTDTADVVFQKPFPKLDPQKVYVANEGETLGQSSVWRALMRRYTEYAVLANEVDYNVGTFACGGHLMDNFIEFLKVQRKGKRYRSVEQLIFNLWLRRPDIKPRITEVPDLFCSVYANFQNSLASLKDGKVVNQKGEVFTAVHFNGSMKEKYKAVLETISMGKPKVSIVISVYNSHEIVRRQLIHLKKMNLPVEIIIVDDNSTPPIEGAAVRTENKLAWTQGLGRNLGAKHAKGEYLFMTDIDHIISKEALEDALNFNGNKMIFRRQIGVLDENGNLTQDREILRMWGYEKENLDASVHGNTFVMKKSVFEELGGYSPETCNQGLHPIARSGDDCYFNTKWNRRFKDVKPAVGRDIYMFPIGRFNVTGNLNPLGLFHNLSQDGKKKMFKGEEE